MWERSVLDAVFNLIGSVRAEPTTVANVASYYTEEVGDMVWDLSQLLRGWRAITLMYGFEERMYGAAEKSGADEPCTLIPEMYPYVRFFPARAIHFSDHRNVISPPFHLLLKSRLDSSDLG